MPKNYKYRKWFTFEGRQYSVRGDTLDEVYEKKAKKIQELKETGRIVSGDTLLKDWAIQCIETYKVNQKEITRQKYMARVRHCILEEIGDLPLKKIKPLQCQQVLNAQAGKSKTQIDEVYHALKFIFDKAVENHLIAHSPAAGIEKPEGYKHHRRALTATERKFFAAVSLEDRRYFYFALMLFCGCRPSEAASAKGSDLSVKGGVPMLHIRGTKTAKSDRYVPVPAELWDKIKDTPKDEFIAVTGSGGKINLNRQRLWKSFTRQINIAMGCRMYRNALIPPYPLADDLVPYCLRHEYCTELARRGIDIRVAQKLMGHADIKMTANIYTNLQDDSLIDMAKALYGYEGGGQGGGVKQRKTEKNRA